MRGESRLYRTTEEFQTLVTNIKNELFLSIPLDKRPLKQDFDQAFSKNCGTFKLLEILSKIEEDLSI